MKKKIALVLAVMMLCGLAACGENREYSRKHKIRQIWLEDGSL